MALEYKAVVMEMMGSLRLRPCVSYRNGRCKLDCNWVSEACSRTVKKSEAKKFLELKGVDSDYDQEKILDTLKELGFIFIYQCSTGFIFHDYYTEDGAPIVAFPI